MKRVIFTVYINIPDDKLDNPAPYSPDGVQQTTTKSKQTKDMLAKYKDQLIEGQRQYADTIGVEYKVFGWDDTYKSFVEYFNTRYPVISHYDIICFYKHYLMTLLSKDYDQICYLDLDVIPNTTDNIFESVDMTKFVVPDSNKEAFWGKTVEPKYYNTCIRNPATKYWNAHAMLSEIDMDPDRDVYNTGIMVASRKNIEKLNYFGGLQSVLDLMTLVKTTPQSMYPKNIQRVFNYDNETAFCFIAAVNELPVHILDTEWHCVLKDGMAAPPAKMYHVIDKYFERFFK